MSIRGLLLCAPLLAVLSCGGADDADQTATDSLSENAANTGGMPGMRGMQSDMMADMKSHMTMMQGVSADSMMALLPAHRQMTGNLLAQMNQEMRDMNMTADAAWSALADSIRNDLTRMPEWSRDEADRLMSDHRGRVSRLIEMHETMMRRMR